jgi:hypothetical protein
VGKTVHDEGFLSEANHGANDRGLVEVEVHGRRLFALVVFARGERLFRPGEDRALRDCESTVHVSLLPARGRL